LFGILQGVALCEDGDRKAKNRVAPAYPELAKKMAITGIVKVETVIDSAGVVKSAKAVGGHPLLIPAAVDAAKKWRFEPSSGETTQVLEFRFSPAS
jgi:TonB family protein